MEKINAAGFEFNAISDLYEVGYEDGDRIIGERFYISATAPDGARFNHFAAFNSHVLVAASEDCESYYRNEGHVAAARAEALCAKIVAAVARGAKLDGNVWVEARPAYGSEAYIVNGQSAIDAYDERRAAEFE